MVNLFDTQPDMMFGMSLIVAPSLMFVMGLAGVLGYRYDVIRRFVAIELMIRSSNLIFCQAAYYYTDVDITAHALVPIVLAVAACEAAVGLGLLVVVYRARGTVDFKSINSLKG